MRITKDIPRDMGIYHALPRIVVTGGILAALAVGLGFCVSPAYAQPAISAPVGIFCSDVPTAIEVFTGQRVKNLPEGCTITFPMIFQAPIEGVSSGLFEDRDGDKFCIVKILGNQYAPVWPGLGNTPKDACQSPGI